MDNRRFVIGGFLILLGIVIGLGNIIPDTGLVVLPIISVAFLFMYFYFGGTRKKRNMGFLIPGTIVGAVGLFAILEESNRIPSGGDPIFLVFLGVAFLLVLLHTMRMGAARWGEKFWPAFPGMILIIVGAIPLTTSNSMILNLIGPAILIVIGIYILFRPMINKKRDIDN